MHGYRLPGTGIAHQQVYGDCVASKRMRGGRGRYGAVRHFLTGGVRRSGVRGLPFTEKHTDAARVRIGHHQVGYSVGVEVGRG